MLKEIIYSHSLHKLQTFFNVTKILIDYCGILTGMGKISNAESQLTNHPNDSPKWPPPPDDLPERSSHRENLSHSGSEIPGKKC